MLVEAHRAGAALELATRIEHRTGPGVQFFAVETVLENGHQQRHGLDIGHGTVRDAGDERLEVRRIAAPAVPLRTDRLARVDHCWKADRNEVPTTGDSPNASSTVAPRSANEERGPRSTPGFTPGPITSAGTYSRV